MQSLARISKSMVIDCSSNKPIMCQPPCCSCENHFTVRTTHKLLLLLKVKASQEQNQMVLPFSWTLCPSHVVSIYCCCCDFISSYRTFHCYFCKSCIVYLLVGLLTSVPFYNMIISTYLLETHSGISLVKLLHKLSLLIVAVSNGL